MNSTPEPENKRRLHASTISGGTLPALEISRPMNARRNSDGSAHSPPPICISEPTPIEPQQRNEFFSNEGASSNNSSRPNTPPSSEPISSVPKNSATAPPGTTTLLDSPAPVKKGNRSRASSLTSSLINDIKESSTIQTIANKIKSRHSEDHDSNASVDGNSSAPPSVAGVSLASSKKNDDFHALFRSVPEDDNLIEDFGCALQKEILLQGRIYISENYLCFNANIFGWVTNLVIAFEDITEIEKKSTAFFIPNAIQVSTDNAKHFFASFLSRDGAYDLMMDIWRNARPDLFNKECEDVPVESEESESYSDESGSYYDSDTEGSFTDDEVPVQATTPSKASMASLPLKENKNTTARRRAISELPRPKQGLAEESTAAETSADGKSTPVTTAATETTDEKPQVNEKTECECGTKGEHYPTTVMDQVYNGTLEKVYQLFFEGDFVKTFLLENQKSTELTIGEWKDGSGNVVATRDISYIKALGGSIGPKSTKCVITEEVLNKDFDNFVSVLTTTCTPDVPSGGSFSCKTKTCMTWAGKGKVRVLVTVLIDFTKSSWLKSTIEKASIDGQNTYYKELDAAIRAHARKNPADLGDTGAGKAEGGKKRKGRRRHRRERKPEIQEKEEKPQTVMQHVLGGVSSILSDTVTGLIDMICSPKASHLTLFCLISMVFINIFIARKMAYVEQQLNSMGYPQQQADMVQEPIGMQQHQRREYNKQEEEDLWDWLGRVDPDKSSPMSEKVFADVPEVQEAVWDHAIKTSQSSKERLERHMSELSEMIKRAEENLQQVTQAVNEQRQKIQKQE